MLNETLEDLATWLPSETTDFIRLVGGLLTALPGGEELEGYFDPVPGVGWKEVELLGRLLTALETPGDVRKAISKLFVLWDGRW